MNTHFKNLGITSLILIALATALLLPSHIAASAQTDDVDKKCTIEMRPFIEQKSKEFREYLTEHFQNKSTNSSLLDLALKRFQVYKNELREKYSTYFPQTGFSLDTETGDVLTCINQMETEIAVMEQLLRKQVIQTGTIKSSSQLMTKLKNINKKLDVLNGRIVDMYGKWETFSDRFPCFIKQCL
jgi:hypothetical protein